MAETENRSERASIALGEEAKQWSAKRGGPFNRMNRFVGTIPSSTVLSIMIVRERFRAAEVSEAWWNMLSL